MTYQTNIHIKEEPSSPPCIDQLGNATTTTATTTTNIEHHHFSGSVLTYGRNPPGGLSYNAGGHGGAPRGVLFPGQQAPVTPPYDVNGEDYKWPIGGPETPASPKSCLKETILSRRRARGEGELENLFEEPKQYKLTKADLERRERRREQNRRAARRCRTKKKIVQTIVCKESEKIGRENEQLHQEIFDLREEISRLHHFIENHRKVCQCPETFNVAGLFFSSDPGVLHEETDAPMSTDSITDAISDAHQTLGDGAMSNSFPQPTSLGGSQDVVGISCHTYTSSSGGLSEKPNVNLPSWDLVNLSSDLPHETFFGEFVAFGQGNSSAEGFAPTPVTSAHAPFSCVTSQASHEMAEMTCVDPNLVQEQQKPSGQLPPFHSILPASQTCSPERRRASPGRQDVQAALPPPYGTYTAILTASGGHPSRLVCGGQPQGFQANHGMDYACVDAYGQDQESYLNYFNNPGEFSKRVTM